MSRTEQNLELVKQAAQGDRDAFEQLVLCYQKPVYNLALRMSGNPEDAYDLAQEAFLRAWKSMVFFKFESSFSTWLYRLTSNVCIDFLRKKKQRGSEVSLQFLDDGGDETELPLPDDAPGPEDQVMRVEDHCAVAAAMSSLEPEYRMALTMYVINGMSYQQIAETLEIKTGTVKSRIARAREKMRRKLLQNGNNSGSISSIKGERGTDV